MADLLDRFWEELHDRYRREREIATGGMASVFLAQDLRHGRPVALKVLHPELATALGIERFLQEIATASSLVHPHILPLFDSGAAGGQLFFVMPFVEGETLRGRLQREQQLPIEDALRIGQEVAGALAYAHSRGVVHRDIKPENILFMAGSAVVADFGVARAVTAASVTRLTPTGVAIGTPTYMSPEQASGDPHLDGRSDIYSLGTVIYEMLAGCAPFTGTSAQTVIQRILSDTPTPLRKLRPSVPDGLERVIAVALAKAPADRFQTSGHFAAALQARAVAADDDIPEDSIAVLPFVNLSPDPDSEYFSDGVSEEIINRLVQLPGLRVAARTSSFAFRSQDLDLPEVGAKLRVATLLEGTVRKSGTRLRITARLIKASDGFPLWSERYDREMTDVFAIQDEIALAIARRLQVTFGESSEDRPPAPPTRNLDAYHLFLRGRYNWTQRGPGLPRARECFTQALKLDANYAAAHAGLADAWTLLGMHGMASPAEVRPNARAAIERALELAPDLADAHCAAGTLKLVFEWDWAGAAGGLRRALDLNPRFIAARYWYGIYLALVERRYEEALVHARRAVTLDPLAALPLAHLGMVLMAAGRHGEAVEPLRKATVLTPAMYVPFLYLGVAYNALGRPADAAPVLEAAQAMSGRQPIAMASLAATLGYLGRMADAEAIHDELVARSRREYVQTAVLSITSAVLGRLDEAFALLHKACDERDGVLIYSRAYPALVALQDDPRMAEIHRRIGFSDRG